MVAVRLVVEKHPDQIFHKILYRQNVGYFEVKITDILLIVFQTFNQKVTDQGRFGSDHRQRLVEKFGKNDKIHGNVLLRGRKDFLNGVLAHEQKLPLLQKNFASVDDMAGLPGTHIDNFHIIVGMFGKMDKPGMGAQFNQAAMLREFLSAYGHGAVQIIEGGVNFLPTVQNFLLFFGDGF